MLLGNSYDNKIDVWALGILLYEMVHGDAPYGEDTPIAEKIDYIKKNKSFEYDESLSADLLDLIKSILNPEPEERLSLDEIFSHPWMKTFEHNYGIDIQSFVTQNSRDAKSVKSETYSTQNPDEESGSQRSIFSSTSTRDRKGSNRSRRLYRDKDTINFGGPDGKNIIGLILRVNVFCRIHG